MRSPKKSINAWDADMITIDAVLDWSEKYLNDLEAIQANRKLITEKARSLHLQDQGMIVELCKYMETYLLAINQRSGSIAPLEGDDLLRSVSETIGTLTRNLEERTGELKKEYTHQITTLVRNQSFSDQTLSDILAICHEYSAITELHKQVPSLKVKQFYIDLMRFSFIVDEKVYDSLVQQYATAETSEEFKRLQLVLEEEVLVPFERTKKSLQEKYYWQYTFRFLPCFAEYKLIDLELPGRWKTFQKEVEIVAGNAEEVISYRHELTRKTRELELLNAQLSSPQLTEKYIQKLQQAKKALVEPQLSRPHLSPNGLLYLNGAWRNYEQAREKTKAGERTAATFFSRQLENVVGAEYSTGAELEAALPTLNRIGQSAVALEDNGLQQRVRACRDQFLKARQGFSRFTSIAGVEEHFYTAIKHQGWPAEQRGKEVYAALSGLDSNGKLIPESFWRRMEKVGVTNVMEVMALAQEYALQE